MTKFNYIGHKFFLIIIVISFFFMMIACDDNFENKIEKGVETKEIKNSNPRIHEFFPGDNGIIYIKYLGQDSIRIGWRKSRDKDSNPLDVTYSIYYSLDNNIDTVEDAKANGTLVHEGFNLNQYTFSGLYDDLIYYINIVATDDSGNEIIYNTAAAETLGEFDH